MYTQSKTIDTVTLINAMVESGKRDKDGSIQYISLIANSVPSVSNVLDYAKIVKDKATLRRLIGICDDISASAYDEGAPVKAIVDSAEQKIFDISNKNQNIILLKVGENYTIILWGLKNEFHSR